MRSFFTVNVKQFFRTIRHFCAATRTTTSGAASAAEDKNDAVEDNDGLTSMGFSNVYILHCYVNLSCKNTIIILTTKLLRITNLRRAKPARLNLCGVCNAEGARTLPLSLFPLLHHKFM